MFNIEGAKRLIKAIRCEATKVLSPYVSPVLRSFEGHKKHQEQFLHFSTVKVALIRIAYAILSKQFLSYQNRVKPLSAVCT